MVSPSRASSSADAFAAGCVVPAAGSSAGEGDRRAPAAPLAIVGSGSRVVGFDVATVDAASSSSASSAASVEGERARGGGGGIGGGEIGGGGSGLAGHVGGIARLALVRRVDRGARLRFVIVRIVVRVRRAGGVVRTRGRVPRRGGLGIRAVVVVVGEPIGGSVRRRRPGLEMRRGGLVAERVGPDGAGRVGLRLLLVVEGRRRGSIDWIPFVRSRRYRRLRRQHHRRLQRGRLDDAPAARERGRQPGVHERERREQRDEHEREDGPDTRHPEGLRAQLLCTSA